MAVPNNEIFNLQNVVNEVNPTTNDLVDCFADANVALFDPSYYPDYSVIGDNYGASNSLLNFRNYGGIITTTTSLAPLPDVTATAATNITSSSFTANWNAVAGADEYLLLIYRTSDNSPIFAGWVGNVTSYNQAGLDASTDYYYLLRAGSTITGQLSANYSNTINVTTLSVTTTTTTCALPDAPTATDATNITSSSFTANWGLVNGATDYYLWIYKDEDGSLIFAGYIGNVDHYDMAGLDANTYYAYHVKAVNACGESVWSNIIYVTTLSATTTTTAAPTTTTTTAAPTTTTTTAALPMIEISQGSFTIGWEWKDADFFAINVTPNSMSWTVTIEETGGQGTSWVRCLPASGTGDLTEGDIKVYAYEENTTGNMRTADVRFSDDSSVADDVVITVTQMANPS